MSIQTELEHLSSDTRRTLNEVLEKAGYVLTGSGVILREVDSLFRIHWRLLSVTLCVGVVVGALGVAAAIVG